MKINLYIRYGIFEKSKLTQFRQRKISALKLKQTFFARLTGRYTAEIINIGMGDDAAETQSFFFFRTVNEIKWKSGFAYYFLNFMKQYRCRLYGSQ